MVPSVEVGAVGWEHPEWLEGFYPPDLPQDWRLAYYGNEYRCVLVPAAVLDRAGVDLVARWCEEVPEGFRFYLELEDAFTERDERRLLLEAVACRLGGFVLEGSPERTPCIQRALAERFPEAAVVRRGAPAGSNRLWIPGVSGPTGPVGLVRWDQAPQPAELRAQIECFVAATGGGGGVLLIDGAPETAEMARTVVDLLGWA